MCSLIRVYKYIVGWRYKSVKFKDAFNKTFIRYYIDKSGCCRRYADIPGIASGSLQIIEI